MAVTLTFLDYQEEIISRGIALECFDVTTGSSVSNSGLERINQSINHILSTRIGTRFFLPEFGSKLYTLIFEPNDFILYDLLKQYVKEALEKWEKRINNIVIEPEVEKYDNTVPIYITYTLINTNVRGNYVYPFNREIYNMEVPALRGEEIDR